MCGSFGSLAVITSATFKLSPAAPASRTVVIEAADAAATAALVDAISAAPMTPTALELEARRAASWSDSRATPVAAEHQAAAAMDLASQYGARARLFAGDEEQQCWAAYERRTWEAPATLFKLSILPATARPGSSPHRTRRRRAPAAHLLARRQGRAGRAVSSTA
jgi:glycolate oxidase FAD binding subunit